MLFLDALYAQRRTEHRLVEPVRMDIGGWEASLSLLPPRTAWRGGRGALIESNTCQVRLFTVDDAEGAPCRLL